MTSGVSFPGVGHPGSHMVRGSGFALVIVLWVLAGLTVIAVVVGSSAQVSGENTKLLRQRVQGEATFLSANARIKIIASTGLPQRMSIDGIKGQLLVDGRDTAITPGESASILDTRGLINLNRNNTEQLVRLIRRCGGSETQTPELVDALADYIDKDNIKRLNGAEAFDYRMADEVEPRNAPLLSREELWRVKGWAAIREEWNRLGCNELITTHSDGRFNPKTAPAALLETAGLTPDAAASIIEARRESVESVANQPVPGLPTDIFGFAGGYVGSTLRVTHRSATAEWALAYELELTPSRDGGPWRMHEIRYRPRLRVAGPASVQLPAPDFEFQDSARPPPNAPSNSAFAK